LDLCVQNRHSGAQGAQLTLHERRKAGPVVPVELLQRIDLLLQRGALGIQAPDDVVISLLRLMVEPSGMSLGILDYLRRTCARIGQDLIGVATYTVAVCLGVADNLFRLSSRIGQCLAGRLAHTVGMGLRVAGHLFCGCLRIRPNAASVVLSTGDMVVGGSLGQNQHLKGLPLRVWIEKVMRLVKCHVFRGRPCDQSFDTALHPTISHETTSVCQR
jgi:hypothetical protein